MSALTFINADLGAMGADTLRVAGAKIAAIGEAPHAGDRVVDLEGDRLLPGLINAHDHLQLNNLPDTGLVAHYANVRGWIEDIGELRRTNTKFESAVAVPREQRLFIGGLKNLLCGVTTVAHHDPYFPALRSASFPTRVVADYGWSHSLQLDGADRVRASYGNTPIDQPWIIHAAEGVDAEAQGEFEQLESLGCIGPNTLLVHGVALGESQRLRLRLAGAGLIWCPASNLRLFGRTVGIHDLISCSRVALGTDSRLSGSRDLLAELNIAQREANIDESPLESLVTRSSARLLRLPDRGVLSIGALADLLVLPAKLPLSKAVRADVRLVMLDGRVRYGDRRYAQRSATGPDWIEVTVDGRRKILSSALAARLRASGASEPGIELCAAAWRAA